MRDYINFIKRDIDGTITDIYLHDERIRDFIANDINKALVVYNAGTDDAPDYKISTVALNYLPTDADGKLLSNLNVNGFKIINLANGTSDSDAINKKQLDDAIKGLGTVLRFKGTVPTEDDLPTTGNKIGDIYIVLADGSEWVWTNQGTEEHPQLKWEKFGPIIDLSGYLKIEDLANTTGSSEITAMTQKATTEAIANAVANRIINPDTKLVGQFLKWDGTNWVAATIADSGVQSVSATDNTITVDNTDPANPKVKTNVSQQTGNLLEVKQDGLYVHPSAGQEQADWEEDDPTDVSYIKNKPTLGTASGKDYLVGEIEDFPSSDKLVNPQQVIAYVTKHNIYQGSSEPTDTSIMFWFDTANSLLKHRMVDTEEPYTYHWEIVGGKVTGVKGAKETTYRTGDVNITAQNVGAVEDPDNKQDGDYLQYNSITGKWDAKTMGLGEFVEHTLMIRTANAEIIEEEHCLHFWD